ncbi:CPBP family intramembrane glutamic endopeptidase [Ghiorsea bivora]|uniref:CPBP family intramembrane glutamic endopeptidase n=1 Tax=Ghiorsea bivora TaxID=1485545 RepID=UPI00068AE867|nr:type II CAAX endopeptidase family protein [Ghiorsea bivora]
MMLKHRPFPLLPYRFLLWGLVSYIVIETLGVLVLQYVDGFQEQTVIVLMRLLELVAFIIFIRQFNVLSNLGLQMPKQYALLVFLKFAAVCSLGAALLYALQPVWFVYIALPAWLHGITGLLLMVVLAPIVEELIFRGLLYRMLRERWGVWLSVTVSAAFFSLIHHGMLLSPQLIGGIIFALAYEWSRSLWVSIGLHMGANAAVYVLVVLGLAA